MAREGNAIPLALPCDLKWASNQCCSGILAGLDLDSDFCGIHFFVLKIAAGFFSSFKFKMKIRRLGVDDFNGLLKFWSVTIWVSLSGR